MKFWGVKFYEFPTESVGITTVTFDAHDEPVHEECVIRKRLIEHRDHWGREESPGEELEEDDDESVVEAGLADARGRHDTLGHLLRLRDTEKHVHHLLSHLGWVQTFYLPGHDGPGIKRRQLWRISFFTLVIPTHYVDED